MTFDLKLNLDSGDLEWNSIRDLSSCEAEALIQQRIHIRLAIERGGFIYDDTGTLGSRFGQLLGVNIPRTKENLEMLVREALEPMSDINIIDVEVFLFNDGSGVITDPRKTQVQISYQLAYGGFGADVSIDSPITITNFQIPV